MAASLITLERLSPAHGESALDIEVLDMVASDQPLEAVLAAVAGIVEKRLPGSHYSIVFMPKASAPRQHLDGANNGLLALARLQAEHDLRRAVQNREFELFYQPQVDTNGRLVGMEALIRWNHPTLGLLSPDKFIPLAEETGLIMPIGDWVIGEASRHCAEWNRLRAVPVKVSVNVSALQLYFSDLPEIVAASLAAASLPASCFEIELTESVLMRNADDSAKALQKLRDIGVTVAIDDFGTGYSSLSYLQKLPVDLLKIDRSFLLNIQTKTAAAVVRAITMIGHSLGLRVVAEGVETAEQMEIIRSIGVDIVQGYLIGRPMPHEKALDWMGQTR